MQEHDIVFHKAFEYVMENEGYHSNDADDPGGETWYGLSKRFLNDHGIYKDRWTKYEASCIYFSYFWLPCQCNLISDSNIAIKYFDMAVNMGAKTATILLQGAINSLLVQDKINVDGVIGPSTRYAREEICSKDQCYQLLEMLCKECKEKYQNIAKLKPTMKKYLNGWINRANKKPS